MPNPARISCNYKPLNQSNLAVFCIVWALAGLLAMILCLNWVPLLLMVSGCGAYVAMIAEIAVILGGAFIFALIPFLLVNTYLEGTQLTATADGLTLPSATLGVGGFRLIRWRDIAAVDYVGKAARGELAILMHDASCTKIKLKHLGDSPEKLFVALEVFATGARWTNRAQDKRDELQNRQLPTDSFTRMWDEELNRRFSSTSFVPLDPGSALQKGRLTIVRQLAFGGFSAVYLAQDEKGAKVVIKESIFSSESDDLSTSKALELFRREAKLLRELDHPQIVKLLDEFVEEGRSYLVLEYAEGESLRDLVTRKGPLSENDVRPYLLQLCEMLNYLHSRKPKVIHRDFTPDNIIVGKDGSLHLVDFGAANELLENATGTFIGKQCYMAPEQVRGKAECESDYYALGGTIHYLLTGQDPEPLSSSSPKSLNADVSCDLDRIVAGLTMQEASDRLAWASEAVNACSSPSVIRLNADKEKSGQVRGRDA